MTTQLANENIEIASDLMEVQLDKIKAGQITKKNLDGAKVMLENSLLSIEDDAYAILSFLIQKKVINHNLSIEDMINKYNKVTVDDIVDAFKDVKLKLIYQLKGSN